MHTYYERINPITEEGSGAYPFRTGISSVRVSIADIIEKIKWEKDLLIFLKATFNDIRTILIE